MKCPKCYETEMEPMGYGDMACPECKHIEYSESQKDFDARMNRVNSAPDERKP